MIRGDVPEAKPDELSKSELELIGYASRCADFDGSVISSDKDEYGELTVALYAVLGDLK